MLTALIGIIITADILLLSVVAISVLFPKSRIWPPPKEKYMAAMAKLDTIHYRYVQCTLDWHPRFPFIGP